MVFYTLAELIVAHQFPLVATVGGLLASCTVNAGAQTEKTKCRLSIRTCQFIVVSSSLLQVCRTRREAKPSECLLSSSPSVAETTRALKVEWSRYPRPIYQLLFSFPSLWRWDRAWGWKLSGFIATLRSNSVIKSQIFGELISLLIRFY